MRMSRLFPRNSFKELSSDILHRRCKAQFAGTFTSMCGFRLEVDALLSPSAKTSAWIGQRKLGYMYQHAKHIPRHKGETVKKHNGRNYNVCK